MNKQIDLKHIIAILFLTLSISLGVALLVGFFKADKDWVGALIGASGNIVGGILGGYIAYFVARFQIEESKKNSDNASKKEAQNLALLLKEEIRNNSLALDSIIQSGTVDPSLIKYNLSRESWLFFSSKVAHLLDETLFISLNTLYLKVQVFQSMTLEEIEQNLDTQQVLRFKMQFDDCVRKLEQFRQNIV